MTPDADRQVRAKPLLCKVVVTAVVFLFLVTAMAGVGAAHEGDHDATATEETNPDSVATEETTSETIPGFTGITALIAVITGIILGIRRR